MRKKLTLAFSALAMVATAPLAAQPRGDEPIAVPTSIRQGIDFVYVDPKMTTVARRRQKPQNWLQRMFSPDPNRNRTMPNPIFLQLGQGLQQYQNTWGRLPQTKIPAGAALKRGSTGKRVSALRTRLGLAPGGGYDERVAQAVSAYQAVHGLGPADGIAGKNTIASLNRGSMYYQRRIAINMERAYRLPAARAFDRYVVVDSGGAEALLYDRDRLADQMRVVVGSAKTKTPMMAVILRDAKANPYWHVPPELIRSLTAKKVGEMGLSYFNAFHYEVLSDWSPNAQKIDPATVNWKAIATGKREPTVMVRQLPGPWNSMRNMKFEMPNDYGIYLHDTPHPELFAKDDRHLSNGCVRLEDYQRFASWVFGRMPPVTGQPEQVIPLPRPVPVYMTYLTVEMNGPNITFRPDPYGFDSLAVPQMFGQGQQA